MDISSNNAVMTLTVNAIYPVPIQLQGFYVEDIFSLEAVDEAESIMGADGYMSVGNKPAIKPLTINFAASSPSVSIFETWREANMILGVLTAQMTITLPSIGKVYTLSNGALMRTKVIPDAKGILQNQDVLLHWENVTRSII